MNNINPNQKFDDMTWMQRVTVIRLMSLFPALTVMVFIRSHMGFRLLKPTWLIVLTSIMLVISVVMHPAAKPLPAVMAAYALAMLGFGLWQRWQRWQGLCKGERWMTYSPGFSYLEYLPLPQFLTAHRRVNRFCDPLTVALVGLLIGLTLCHILGVWIMFSAFFLYVFEQDLYDRELNRELDIHDSLLASEVQADIVKRFKSGQLGATQSSSIQQTAGIPTGLAPDIAAQIQARRANRSNLPAENLAGQAA